jgi:pantoate--beta-alanine ligase
MIICKKSKYLSNYINKIREQNVTVGFVPTMGALHTGHLSLLSTSKSTAGFTVCSIFVNRAQFNNNEDYFKYPSTLEKDILLLEEVGCDLLFLPEEKEIYPDEASKNKHFEIGKLEETLEGKFRPGHFQGVCLVVERLLQIVRPDYLFLGQKDYQQYLIITNLVKQLSLPTIIKLCPIVREPNGLAMSSRNLRLNEAQQKVAPLLYKTLVQINNNIKHRGFQQLKKEAIANLEKSGFKIDYLELADLDNLTVLNTKSNPKHSIILIAAYVGDIRLIDNLIIKD